MARWRDKARGTLREAAEVARAAAGAVDRATSSARTLRWLLRTAEVDVVFDVGANTGGYARALRRLGYRGRIVSFEPGSVAFGKLARDAAGERGWEVVQAAIGQTTGSIELHVSANSVSSSLLHVNDRHVSAAPSSRADAHETVPMLSFADALARHAREARRVFVKLDVQGFEARILAAMEPLDERIVGVMLEMSLVHLYDGDETIDELFVRLRRCGLDPLDLVPGFRDARTGALLQVDGLFARRALLQR